MDDMANPIYYLLGYEAGDSDGEHLIYASTDIINIAYERIVDTWWRKYKSLDPLDYVVWCDETGRQCDIEQVYCGKEDVFLYAIEGGIHTRKEAKSLALFLGYTEDEFEEICKGLTPYDFAEETDNENN